MLFSSSLAIVIKSNVGVEALILLQHLQSNNGSIYPAILAYVLTIRTKLENIPLYARSISVRSSTDNG